MIGDCRRKRGRAGEAVVELGVRSSHSTTMHWQAGRNFLEAMVSFFQIEFLMCFERHYEIPTSERNIRMRKEWTAPPSFPCQLVERMLKTDEDSG